MSTIDLSAAYALLAQEEQTLVVSHDGELALFRIDRPALGQAIVQLEPLGPQAPLQRLVERAGLLGIVDPRTRSYAEQMEVERDALRFRLTDAELLIGDLTAERDALRTNLQDAGLATEDVQLRLNATERLLDELRRQLAAEQEARNTMAASLFERDATIEGLRRELESGAPLPFEPKRGTTGIVPTAACPHCQGVFPARGLKKHIEACAQADRTLPSDQKSCRHCGAAMRASNLARHELSCAVRAEHPVAMKRCPHCNTDWDARGAHLHIRKCALAHGQPMPKGPLTRDCPHCGKTCDARGAHVHIRACAERPASAVATDDLEAPADPAPEPVAVIELVDDVPEDGGLLMPAKPRFAAPDPNDVDPRFQERPEAWPERSAALLAVDQLHELRPTPAQPHIPAEIRRTEQEISRQKQVKF